MLKTLSEMKWDKLVLIGIFVLILIGMFGMFILKYDEHRHGVILANETFVIPTTTKDEFTMYVYLQTQEPVPEAVEPLLRETVRGFISHNAQYASVAHGQAQGLWNYLQQSAFPPKRVTFWKTSSNRERPELIEANGFFACELPRGCYKE